MHRSTTILLALALAPAALADEGKLVYGHAGAIYEQAPSAKATAKRIADLPAGAGEVTAIEARGDGGLLALSFASTTPAWLERGAAARLVTTVCAGRLHPAPTGLCLLCAAGDSAAVVCEASKAAKPAPQTLKDVGRDAAFLGSSDAEIVALAGDDVVVTPRASAGAPRVVARCRPRSGLLVAPDGQRAVAIFGEGASARVKSFFLDGEGVARQLGGPAVPIAWSGSSEWVLIQNGAQPAEGPVEEIEPLPGEGDPEGASPEGGTPEASSAADRALLGTPAKKPAKKKAEPKKPEPPRPPPTAACVTRATGGEMKCWDGYVGLGFSPDSQRVLLRRERALFVGEIAGVNAAPPVRVVEDADAGVWVP